MYALVTLLSLCVAGTFGLVFVQRRRAWLPAFAASLALLMYSHNWGLFLAVGTGVAFLAAARRRPRQARHAPRRGARLRRGRHRLPAVGPEPAVPGEAHRRAVVRGAAAGRRARRGRLPARRAAVGDGASRWRPGPASPVCSSARALRGPKARAVLALLTMGAVALALAWVTSQISPAWAIRYLSVLLGPLLLLGGAGMSRAGTLGLVVAAILAVLWLNPRTHALETQEQRPHRRRPRRGPPRAGRPRRRRPPRAGPGHAPLPAEGPALGERARAGRRPAHHGLARRAAAA